MSVLALDLEDGLLRYASVPGEENVHNCGRLLRILHMLKMLKLESKIGQQMSSSCGGNLLCFQLPTNEEKGKIVKMGVKSAIDNYNINAYKTIWELCDGQIEGMSIDRQFISSDLMDEKLEMLTASLDQEKLTRIASNMRPVLEELTSLKNRVGDYQSALRTLTEYRQAWIRDADADLQYCQLLALTSLFAAAATGSPDCLAFFSTSPWSRSEADLAAAMHYFMKSQFEEAVNCFHKVEPIEAGVITAIITPKDAGLYAALAAMAALPKRSSTESEITPAIVDYSPTSRDVLLSLRNCEYTSVMEVLKQARPRLLLDPFIAPVWTSIFGAVKRRAVIEFCSVFDSVSFTMISAGTGVDINEIENLLLAAVQKNLLNGRLDLIDKTFTKRQVEPVSRTCQAAQSLAEGAHHNAVQSAIIQARFSIAAPANREIAAQMATKQDVE